MASDDKFLAGFICQRKSCGSLLDKSGDDELTCPKCKKTYPLAQYQATEEKIRSLHKISQQEADVENYERALKPIVEALTLGTPQLHSRHYLNYMTYYFLSVVTSEIGDFESAVQFTLKQLDCLSLFTKEEIMVVKEAKKYRDLATYLQEWGKDVAAQGSNPNDLVDESYKAFLKAHYLYSFLFGKDHWYTATLKKVIDMLDGKCDAQELVDF